MHNHLNTTIPFEEELRLEHKHDAADRKAQKEIQWLVSCPEALPRVKELIKEKSEEITKLEHDYRDHVAKIQQETTGEVTTYFRLALVKQIYVPTILALKKDRVRLNHELSHVQPLQSQSRTESLNVEHAKEVQLADIVTEFTDMVKPTGRNSLTIRCPFHEPDRHPSCVIYTATNSFCCYACGNKGDVITFVEKALGYEFRDAVQWLERRSL